MAEARCGVSVAGNERRGNYFWSYWQQQTVQDAAFRFKYMVRSKIQILFSFFFLFFLHLLALQHVPLLLYSGTLVVLRVPQFFNSRGNCDSNRRKSLTVYFLCTDTQSWTGLLCFLFLFSSFFVGDSQRRIGIACSRLRNPFIFYFNRTCFEFLLRRLCLHLHETTQWRTITPMKGLQACFFFFIFFFQATSLFHYGHN